MSKEQMYGYFPGGAADPRGFVPDLEVCTPEEIEAHRLACEAWERGERPLRFEVSGRVTDNTIRCGSAYGMGTYEIEMPDDEPPPGAEEDLPTAAAAA